MPRSSVRANPFYHPPRQWQIHIHTPQKLVAQIEDVFSDVSLATLSFERDERTQQWQVDIITDTDPATLDIKAMLAPVSSQAFLISAAPLDPKNWLSEVEQSFPPLTISAFYVYGSHITAPIPHSAIPLKINAGLAFGSGEHATTSGCLIALHRLSKYKRFLKPLDIGCGSGILALAMAKLWKNQVIAADIDPVSVQVTRHNAHANHVQKFIRATCSDGYDSPLIHRNAPYDLITANILARPLVKMAPMLARNLEKGGIAVLSGLLVRQEQMVLNAHRLQGLKRIARIHNQGWSTLIIKRP